MHIERNICDSLLGTMLNINGKSKDTDKARLDLMDLGIRSELHLYKEGNRWMKPHPSFALTLEERREFGKYMKSMRFPDGFASNLTKNVNDHDEKITILKSHDYHVIMQRLLIPGIRKYLPKEVSYTVAQLCNFFKLISTRTLGVDELRKVQKNVSLILSTQAHQVFYTEDLMNGPHWIVVHIFNPRNV